MSRLPRSSRARATAFVVTILVVVAGVSGAPALLGPPSSDTPEFAVDRLVPERAAAEGEVTVQRRNGTGVVLVDTAHFNRFEVDEVQPLIAAVTAAGYEVDLLEVDEDLDRSLSRADAYVVIDPGRRYTEAEAARVARFVDRGGRLLLAAEPTRSRIAGGLGGVAPVRNRMSPLAAEFGIEYGEAYLFNLADNDGNHLNVFAQPAGPSALTDGLGRTALYTATTVQAREGQTVLVAGEGTRSSRTDALGTYPVAAVNGNVLAVGDATFLRRGNYNVVDNERLLANVVGFLVDGEKARTVDGYRAFVADDPTVHYTGPGLLPAAQRVATDLRDAGVQPSLALRRQAVSPDRTDVLVTTFGFLAQRDGLDTGIQATDRRVRVGTYGSEATGVIVVRAPDTGYDLVIAADTPERARQGAGLLAGGSIGDHLVDERTAIVRTGAAVRLVNGSDDGAD